jgi:hypothetical protein
MPDIEPEFVNQYRIFLGIGLYLILGMTRYRVIPDIGYDIGYDTARVTAGAVP